MKKIRGEIRYFGNWGRRVDGKPTRVKDDGRHRWMFQKLDSWNRMRLRAMKLKRKDYRPHRDNGEGVAFGLPPYPLELASSR